jgi:hypothetical protein
MIKLAANLQNLIKASEKNRALSLATERPFDSPDYTPSSAGDYALYGGAGALGGAGLGALINYLRDESVAQGALVGAGLGGAAGLGTRGLTDYMKSRSAEQSFREREGDALSRATGGLGGRGTYPERLVNPATPIGREYAALLEQQERAKAFADLEQRSHEDRIARGEGGEYAQRIKDLSESLENQGRANTIQSRIDKTGSHKRAASSAGDYAMYGGGGALGGAGIGALVNYLRDKSLAQGALVGGGIGGAAGLGTRGIMDLLGAGAGAGAEEGSPTPAHGGDFRRSEKEQQLAEAIALRDAYGSGPQANAAHAEVVRLTRELGDPRAKNTT